MPLNTKTPEALDRKRAKQRVYSAKYREKYPERVTAFFKNHYEKNKERILERCRIYNEKNRSSIYQKRRAYQKKWKEENKDRMCLYWSNRRARQRNLLTPLTEEEKKQVVALYVKARELTKLHGEPYHVDHIKPLARGGLHHPSNLQVMRGIDNIRKNSKFPAEAR